MVSSAEQKRLRDVLRTILYRWQIFLVGATSFAALAMIASHYIPLKYTAKAVFERRTDTATSNIGPTKAESFRILKLTLIPELTGPKALTAAVEELGLTQTLPRNVRGRLTPPAEIKKRQLINEIAKGIKVNWKVRSDQVDLIEVSLTHRNPTVAAEVPNILVKNYINWASEKIIQRLQDSRDFLLRQVAECNAQIIELTKKKISFETKHNGTLLEAFSPAEDQSADPADETTRAFITALDVRRAWDRIQKLTADIETLRRQRTAAHKKLSLIKELIQSAKRRRMEQQLRHAREQLETATTVNNMAEQHPMVQTLRSKITRLENRIKQLQTNTTPYPDYADTDVSTALMIQLAAAQTQLDTTTSELERLENRLASFRSVMANSDPVRGEYFQLVKALKEHQDRGRTWQRRLSDVKMALAAEIGKRRTQLNTVQLAEIPRHPFFPRLWVVIGFALGGGLVFGYGLAFLVNAVDRSITIPRDAAGYFDIPIHAVIDEITTHPKRLALRVARRGFALSACVILLGALILAAFSTVLRLQYPEQYQKWKSSPSQYVYKQIVELPKSQPNIQ